MTATDPALLARAKQGDEKAFEALLAPHRRRVAAHCYRMLGSLADADDATQDTWLRAWKGLAAFEERAALSTWLYKIATRASLDVIDRRRARTLPHHHGTAFMMTSANDLPTLMAAQPDPEVPWLEPVPGDWVAEVETPERALSTKESVRLAFIAALQQLPPQQRAVLLLREVLGWSAEDTANLLESTVPAVNSALQRARDGVRSRPALERPRPPEASIRKLLDRYVAAWETGAPEVLAGVLREDALLTMPPLPMWLSGRDSIVQLVLALRAHLGPIRFERVEAAGGPALLGRTFHATTNTWRAAGLHVFEVNDDQIVEIHAFIDPALLARFGNEAR